MSETPPTAVQVRVYGRVQGVWYRAWTTEQALKLGLSGWVRNRTDGSVEAVFAGPPGNVEAMIARCHEGPPAARVDEVVCSTPRDAPHTAGFRQLPTA